MQIFAGLRALFMLFLHIKNKDEVGIHNLILNILFAIVLFMLVGSVLIFVPTLILLAYLIQRAVLRKVDQMMRIRTGDLSDESLPELKSEEKESATVPAFVITDANSSTEEFVEFREAALKRARAGLNQKLITDAVIAFGYFVLALLGNAVLASAGKMIGSLVLTSVILRWLFMAKQYRAVDAHYKKSLLQSPLKIFGQPLANLLDGGGTNLLIGLLIVASILGAIAQSEFSSALGLVLVGTVHFFIMRPRSKAGFNIKLLLLRTFNIHKNSLFTFGRLINFWKRVGNHFTVVDASYIRHKYSLKSQRTMGVLLLILLSSFILDYGLGLLIPQLFSADSIALYAPLVLFISPLVVTLIFIRFEYYQIERSVVQSRAAIQERIRSLEQRPRGLADSTLRGMPAICHDNTWRGTVAEMLKTTDIVLMDLRGFSEKKKGCEYELDFLLDNIPVNRVLILVDAKDDQEFIRNAILQRWKYLRSHSPNLEITDPRIQIYKCSEENEIDVQGIFDRLLGTAFISGHAEGIAISKSILNTQAA